MSIKRTQSELSDSDSTYRTIVENSIEAVIVVSGLKIVYANKVAARLCGYDEPEGIIGKEATSFISQKYREQFKERIKSRLLGEPQPVRFDHELVKKDSSIV
jgi:PAS domain S-box-containing protein